MICQPSLKQRSLLTLNDLTNAEMLGIIDFAIALKARRDSGTRGDLLLRKNIALVFEKGSTRTRCAAAIATREEGGNVEYLTRADTHFGVKESVKDTARVLGRMFDGILFRGYAQKTVEDLARHSGVPVWNGLTDDFHPTQVLADLMTMREHFGRLKGLRLAYVGDGRNNMANSLMIGCAKAGVDFVNCTPRALSPDAGLLAKARAMAAANGSVVEVFENPATGVRGANVVYTDVWISMGEEAQKEERMKLLAPYQVNEALVAATGTREEDFIFLHCLPAFHDCETALTRDSGAFEVSDAVFRAPYSRVFDEAENRMHTIKALYVSALCDGACF